MGKSMPCRLRDGVRTMRLCEPAKPLPPVGISNSLSKKISALALVTVIACATSASAQSASAPPTASFGAAIQAQNPLSPVYSLLNENSTNFKFGPLENTQDVLLVEPVIPIRLTPGFNLITRWITPVIWQPALARSMPAPLPPMPAPSQSIPAPLPAIGSEFGLGNITPQFFFTPAHQGNGFVWGLGFNAWLPTATDDTLGINKWGGGPTAVALWIQGPLLFGVLFNQTWAGDQSHGTSATFDRIDQMAIQPFVFYNLSAGWYVASLPIFTADWTVSDRKWTVPIGGGIGRVMPLGNVNVNARLDAYDNVAFGLGDAEVITNVGDWTLKFTLHFVLPNARTPALF
jgi:hypothetical protein